MTEKLPTVRTVRETWEAEDGQSFVIIAPDPHAGLRHRYSVIRISEWGRARCIGRELDLPLARKVAQRPATQDGRPL